MYQNSILSTKINICINHPGVYTFLNESGTGKTYLFHLLRTLQQLGENIGTYTYTDLTVNKQCPEDLLEQEYYDIIMFDRYDMYANIAGSTLERLSNKNIILVDCKGELQAYVDDDICFIDLTKYSIEVTT